MAKIAIGRKAPDFALPTDSGAVFRLSEQRGKPVVLFFYPTDDTEGCTIENLEFSALQVEFSQAGAVLVGISPDTVASHCAFRDKYRLKATLAADPEHLAIAAYGVWGPKTTFGRAYVGLIRTSFLIGADGRVAGIWPVTRIKGHAEKVLAAVKALAGGA